MTGVQTCALPISGAAGAGGFKGLGGRFSRRNLLRFGVEGVADLRFTRLDNAAAVHCRFLPNSVAADPRLGALLPAVVHEQAMPEERLLFGQLWQDRVRRLLLDHADAPAVVADDGGAIGGEELPHWLRRAQLVNLSLETNGGMCRDLLRVRYGEEVAR